LNAELIVENLRQFAIKYPYQEAHRLLAEMIISLLKIRNLPQYQLNVPSIVAIARGFMVKKIKKRGGSESEATMEMFKWTQLAFFFGELSGEDAGKITDECNKLLPQKKDSLGQFLSQKLGLKEEQQHDADHFCSEGDRFSIGIVRAFSGLCEEKFQFCPDEAIPDKVLTDLIQEYYDNRGYETEKDDQFVGLSAEKGDLSLTVAVSNYGDSIFISVMSS